LAAIKTQASTIADLSARIDALETKPKRTAAKPKPEF
jgi:outer membrane murein-binding lipoprotein Lpp